MISVVIIIIIINVTSVNVLCVCIVTWAMSSLLFLIRHNYNSTCTWNYSWNSTCIHTTRTNYTHVYHFSDKHMFIGARPRYSTHNVTNVLFTTTRPCDLCDTHSYNNVLHFYLQRQNVAIVWVLNCIGCGF